MLTQFHEQIRGIYRLRVPFDTIYTSVFLIKAADKTLLVDCAAAAHDVDAYILPALNALGCRLAEVDTLILTHRHGDHAGGKDRILELAPHIEVVTDVRPVADKISTYPLAGHTEDSIGILDERTHTLISGDGLQGDGVGKYRRSIRNKMAYLETLQRIGQDERIESILFSHAYEPWNHDFAHGRPEVDACLSECKRL